MACENMLKPRQTKEQRKAEVRKAALSIDKLLAAKKVTVKVGPQGAMTFVGIPDSVRDGMTDVCILQALKARGSVATRVAIQRAEQQAGRKIDPQMIANGTHSHDGGATWSRH